MIKTWLDLSKLPAGTRVAFAEAWDIFAEDVLVPAGTTGSIAQNDLNECSTHVSVLPDDESLRAKLAEWDGCIHLSPPLDPDTGKREPDWLGLSPLAVEEEGATK